MDGLNDARAMRIAEVVTDYQQIQNAILQYQPNLSQAPASSTGNVILRQCLAEANALLAAPFAGGDVAMPASPGEDTKKNLQRCVQIWRRQLS